MTDIAENNNENENVRAEAERALGGENENETGVSEQSEIAENENAGEQKQPKHSKISVILNKFFHHIDRGASMKSEVTAGIVMCILAVCGMFINMQTVSGMLVSGPYASASTEQLAANGEIIAAMYFASMLIAFIGSMAMGLIARLPFVQVTGLGLSTVLISLVGTSNGLTYYNLLAISLFGSLVYTVLVSVPVVKKWIINAVPDPVKKAIPTAFGVLLAFIAMRLSGLFGTSAIVPNYGTGTELGTGSTVGISSLLGFGLFDYSTDRFHPTLLLACLSVVLAFVLIAVFKSRKAKHPYLWSLLISQVALIIAQVLFVAINWEMMTISFDSLFCRAWMIGSEDAMQLHLGNVFANMSLGKVFTEGFDFSAYTGNVFLLFLTGIMTMSATFFLSSGAVANATCERAGVADEKGKKLAYICNAGTNVLASVLGTSPVAVGAQSFVGAEDNAKSGLSSVVAAIGFFVSMFMWIIPAVFLTSASSAIEMNLYGHYGKVLQLLTECGFGIADGVMAVAGISMTVYGLKNVEWNSGREVEVVLATVAATFFFGNIAYGVAVGIILNTLIAAVSKPQEGVGKLQALKAIGIPNYVATGVSLLMLLFAYLI